LLASAYAVLGAGVYLWARLLALGVLGTTTAARWRERLGYWRGAAPDRRDSERALEPGGIWVHAASVGEIAAARPLLRALRKRQPHRSLLLTCNTATGRRIAAALDVDAVRYFPIDFAPVVTRVLNDVRPALFVFVETEIWPTILTKLPDFGARSVMVNACVSDRSYPRYRRVLPIVRAALSSIEVVCARDDQSLHRLRSLGAREESLVLTGDMKLDALSPAVVAQAPRLLDSYLPAAPEEAHDAAAEPVLVAASTREGEEAPVLEALRLLRERGHRVRLVLAPRHPERFEAVCEMVRRARFSMRRRSEREAVAHAADWDVLVVDTLGELRGFFKGAQAAFVGGSLVPIGAHNVLEPAAFGLPVAVGPNLADVSEQALALAEAGALRVVEDARELADVWSHWLDDPVACQRAGAAGAALVADGRGAVQEVMERLEPLFPQKPRPPAMRESGAS
jgi:3-deoxy-D-manno-octulosonic-acid transferase